MLGALVAWTCKWLLLLSVIDCCTGNTWVIPIPNLRSAMEGYDPVMSSFLERPDPGIRNQIFEPFADIKNKTVILNSFVDRASAHLYCDSALTGKTLRNYNSYKKEKSSSLSFSIGADVSLEAGIGSFSFSASAGFAHDKNSEMSSMKRFFQEVNGEVVISTVKCTTHAVSISAFEKPVFTKAFLTALKNIHSAAKNSDSSASKEIFVKFINSYGTHFMRKTFLGSKLTFEKLFTSKDIDSGSANSRSKCVSNSAHASLEGSYGLASASASFNTAAAGCSNSADDDSYFNMHSLYSEKIVSIGSLPLTDLKDWANNVKDSPVPVDYELDKISNLFTQSWFNTIPANSEIDPPEMMDGAAMYQFFEEKSAAYCQIMLGKKCEILDKGCGLNDNCTPGTKCVNDPDSVLGYRCDVKFGAVIIVGGYNGIKKSMPDVEAINTWQPPDLPFGVHGHTLTLVGSRIYACGGTTIPCSSQNRCSRRDCHVLDRSPQSPSWVKTATLPSGLKHHSTSTAVIGSHIWFINSLKQLFSLNTRNHLFRTYNLQMDASSGNCIVSNKTHAFVIGVGPGKNEIWVNSDASSPVKWHKVANMRKKRFFHACLWFHDDVYITGNFKESDNKDVEIFNTITREVTQGSPLAGGRSNHKMMVYNGKPAVAGGSSGLDIYFDTIETFDLESKTWKFSQHLRDRKSNFGLVQLYE